MTKLHRAVTDTELMDIDEIQRMDGPARFLNLNQIEHVSYTLERRLAARHQPTATIPDLREESDAILQHITDSPILSMDRRCKSYSEKGVNIFSTTDWIFLPSNLSRECFCFVFFLCSLMQRYIFIKIPFVSFWLTFCKFCSLFPYQYILRMLWGNLCLFKALLHDKEKPCP